MSRSQTNLPIQAILDDLRRALDQHPSAVLQAPPGAGKTTGVPPALLDASWLQGRTIFLLAPRRLAARAAARRMAAVLGEPVGKTVGYRVRYDSKVGPHTRIVAMTEGVLIRMLQRDPGLQNVGLVIFDEFHERSLDADLGLALCLDIQGVLNRHLKVLVMSATMDLEAVSKLLGDCPVIASRGRAYPVEIRYVGRHTPDGSVSHLTRAIMMAVREDRGSILVFLPGAAEIRRAARKLVDAGLDPRWEVTPLLGSLSARSQDRAIAPPVRGRRKIVLATSIAETSLTIEGIHVVVDSGLQRIPRFDVRSGMSRLVTIPLSRASADQRSGRAGRLGPGLCLRLWSEAMHPTLVSDRRPEMLETDLSRLVLELARWGVRDPKRLLWLDPPPEGAYAKARVLLQSLGALDASGMLTAHGKAMAQLPIHPRLAHMLEMSRTIGQISAACDLAALLTERDPVHFEAGKVDADIRIRYDLLQAHRDGRSPAVAHARVNRAACDTIVRTADQLARRMLFPNDRVAPAHPPLGQLLAWAYPDRIGQRRKTGHGRYRLSGGQGVRLDEADPLASADMIVALEVDGQRRDGRIYRAASYDAALLEKQFAASLHWHEMVDWDASRNAVDARRELRFDALSLHSRPLEQPDPERVRDALIAGIRQNDLSVLPWHKALRHWQQRVCFLHRLKTLKGPPWPDLSDEWLLRHLEQWLAPFLEGMTRMRELAGIDLRAALFCLLSHVQHGALDRLAPTHYTVPSGSRIAIDYSGPVPILAVRIQEMFGLNRTPAVADGQQALLLHLLSPAHRPVQVTQDLAGFWRTAYHDVKKELKGRYPKHYWPDDPLTATATARAKPRGGGAVVS